MEKGQQLLVPLTYLTRHDPRWDDDAAFRPERWLAPEGGQQGWAMPFGAGNRSCIGAPLAMAEMKARARARACARGRRPAPRAARVLYSWAPPAPRAAARAGRELPAPRPPHVFETSPQVFLALLARDYEFTVDNAAAVEWTTIPLAAPKCGLPLRLRRRGGGGAAAAAAGAEPAAAAPAAR